MEKGRFAEIIINISHENVDRPYTYKVPEDIRDLCEIGTPVNVPFGNANKVRKGFIVGFTDTAEIAEDKLKYIESVCDKDISLSDMRIRLAVWIKRNYGGTLIAALKTVLPVKQKTGLRTTNLICRIVSEDRIDELIEETLATRKAAQLRLLYALKEEEKIPQKIAADKLHISTQVIKKLAEMGVIEVIEETRKDKRDTGRFASKRPDLTEDQKRIVDSVREDFENNDPGVYLIHGVTGSGKTEVYMGIIEEMLNKGRQAIVLIPEIALTYQTLMRFYHRFGDRVGIINSTLSAGEKYDVFSKAESGEIDIVIGPRSALFVPFPALGVIVIDEEHESTYKSETVPKYHARETAVALAKMYGASVVLGSATPSIDAYYRAETGEYRLFELTKRPTGNELPNVYITDMRDELRGGNRSIISKKLDELLKDRISRGEQSMLFINRRGLAGFVSCRACGFVVKCPHCDVSLTLHRNGKMMCHYCGYTIDKPALCPECGSKYMLPLNAGTEEIEDTIQKMYPGVRTLRMDADTTREKESYEKIISRFLDGEADVLIGTQMIVKGHDFKNVTLVGVLAADMSLFESDFKASERTFDLLTQAAGRAGRGEMPGDVVIQTYKPDHYCIRYAAAQDYKGFYEEEAGLREVMDYPPAGHMLNILVTGKNEAEALKLTTQMCTAVRKYFDSMVVGPAPAYVSKINDVYRFVCYIRNKDYDKLVEIKDYLEESLMKIKNKKASVMFDFDPQGML
ncbi:MAG: primosomal protein N' [Lachnospiraceae bacterium]|nr:primosomal protein N' [Lachnospiraceae bacterium]